MPSLAFRTRFVDSGMDFRIQRFLPSRETVGVLMHMVLTKKLSIAQTSREVRSLGSINNAINSVTSSGR